MRKVTEEAVEEFNRVFVSENLWKDDKEETAFIDIKRIIFFLAEKVEDAYEEGMQHAKSEIVSAVEKAAAGLWNEKVNPLTK